MGIRVAAGEVDPRPLPADRGAGPVGRRASRCRALAARTGVGPKKLRRRPHRSFPRTERGRPFGDAAWVREAAWRYDQRSTNSASPPGP